MGITDAVSGNQVQHQQAIDAVPGSQQISSAQTPAAGIRGILKASSSQSSTEAIGFTETRVVLKADSGAVVGCETELIEKHEFQVGSKTIPQRDVSKTGCKEACLGKKPEKTIEAICGAGCLALFGVTLISLAGAGYLSLPNNTTLSVNDTQHISTSSLNLTVVKNMTEVLQDVISAASAQDSDDSSGTGGLYGAGIFFIALAIAAVVLTRFCQSSDSKKAGKGPGSETQNSDAVDRESCSQKSDSAYGGSQTLSFASGSEYGSEREFVPEPCFSHKKKKTRRPVEKMSPVIEVEAGPSGLSSISDKKSDAISMEDLLTPDQKKAVNRSTRLELVRVYPAQAKLYDVETGCFTKGTKYPISAEYAPADDSEEDESSPFLPSLVTVDVEVMPPYFAPEYFEMVNMSAKEGGASTQLMEGEFIDETALTPFEGSDAERLYHFIEENAFDSLEPDLSRKLKKHLSKMSKVDFKSFAKDVGARDEVRVRQSINKMVTCKFPHFSHEKREQLVQKFAEVINTFPVSPPGEVVAKDTAG